jgi:hypothetical protein
MLRFSRAIPLFASILAIALAPGRAHAQATSGTSTTTTTTATPLCSAAATSPTVTLSSQTVPERYINGVVSNATDVGTSTRPPALNPTGISYSDCLEDMILQFRLVACGFNGDYNLQVWASKSDTCTTAGSRGEQGGIADCWPVSQGVTGLVQADGEENISISVRDIVGPQNDSPSPTSYSHQGIGACSAQATFLAVPINVNFVPVDSDGNPQGSALSVPLTTDMVGPPPPTNVSIGDGDTLFVVNWTANVDTDTAAYDVVIDPAPGQQPTDAANSTNGSATTVTTLVCPDAQATDAVSSTTEAGEDDASDDAAGQMDGVAQTVDATTAGDATVNARAEDAGACHTVTVVQLPTGNTNGGNCNDSLLSGGSFADGGASDEASVPVEEFDEAGNLIDSGVAISTGGGIWTPPAGHVINPNATTGTTVSGETDTTYTVSGLTNGTTYTVVLAAVDAFGNVGPPSVQACDYPAPVNDFWKIYRTDGGQAGGGLCALEAVGAPAGSAVAFAGAGALVVAGMRRRRRTRR